MKRSTGIKTTILFLFFISIVSNSFAQEYSSTTFFPNISKTWTKIAPRPALFMGRFLRPKCSGGPLCKGTPLSCSPGDTKFYFCVKGGTANNLLIFFNGGGACWDSMNCLYIPTYSKEINTTVEGLNQADGIFDMNHSANPFKDWSFVFIPYCTGDMHWGSNDKAYPDNLNLYGGEPFTIHHRGFDNFLVVLKWMTGNFKKPDNIFVTGSSAGSYGAILGFPYIQKVYPSSKVNMLGDAGSGVISEDFKTESINNWGFQSNLPVWISGFDRPFSEYTIADMYKMMADYYSDSNLAQYTTAWDSVQTFFYNIMLNIDEPAKWFQLDSVECDWHHQMIDSFNDAAEATNYRYYIGEGSDHTLLGSDKFYKEESAGVPFVEWVNSMIGNQDGIPRENAACPDCMNPCQ